MPAGPTSLEITTRADQPGHDPARVVLLGGPPFGEQIVMWWNFVGRTHDEIVAFRRRWQAEVITGADHAGAFGWIEGWDDGTALPAPELPNVRLRPREQP